MLDSILEEIKSALELNKTIEIDASPKRYGWAEHFST